MFYRNIMKNSSSKKICPMKIILSISVKIVFIIIIIIKKKFFFIFSKLFFKRFFFKIFNFLIFFKRKYRKTIKKKI